MKADRSIFRTRSSVKLAKLMTQTQKYAQRSFLTGLRSAFQHLFSTERNQHSEVLEVLSRRVVPFGGNWLESQNNSKANDNSRRFTADYEPGNHEDISENRYSVLYLLNDQYQHVGCSSQAEAQSLLGRMMTDEIRIPVGIYDAKNDSFEWELVGQYFHSKDSVEEQRDRAEQILTISRALRRRDSSWQPGFLQKPSIFA
jgi:hypothetical protein